MSDLEENDMQTFLINQLTNLNIEDVTTYCEYILGILDSTTIIEKEEKKSAIEDCLQSVVLSNNENEVTLIQRCSKVALDTVDKYDSILLKEKAKNNGFSTKNVIETFLEKKVETPPNIHNKNKHQNEDVSIKKSIVDKYGFQVSNLVDFDEDGNVLLNKQNKVEDEENDESTFFQNDNRERVKMQGKIERLRQKTQHEDELKKRQQQKLKEQQKKEKERQRVTKKERRSGR